MHFRRSILFVFAGMLLAAAPARSAGFADMGSWFESGGALHWLARMNEEMNLWFAFEPGRRPEEYLRVAKTRFEEYQRFTKEGKLAEAQNAFNEYRAAADEAAKQAAELREEGRGIVAQLWRLHLDAWQRLQYISESIRSAWSEARAEWQAWKGYFSG